MSFEPNVYDILFSIIGLLAPLWVLHRMSVLIVLVLRPFGLWRLVAVAGVPVHELSHALAALLLGHKVLEVKLFQIQGDGGLGYVTHSHRYGLWGWFTTAIVSLAPILGGYSVFFAITFWLNPSFLVFSSGDLEFADLLIAQFQYLLSMDWGLAECLWVYLSLSVLTFMPPSSTDYKASWPAVFAIVAVFGIASYFFSTVNAFYMSLVSMISSMVVSAVALIIGVQTIFLLSLWVISLILKRLAGHIRRGNVSPQK